VNVNLVSAPPDWFKLQDYEYTNHLNATGWYRVLKIRQYLREYFREQYKQLHQANPNWCSYTSFWTNYYEPRVLHYQGEAITEFDEDGALPFPPPVTTVEEIQSFGPLSLQAVGDALKTYVENLGYRLLMVDPNCTDVELTDSFATWLAELRNEHPLPIKRSGRKALNVTFTEADHFSSWRDHRILAVFDLYFWAEVTGKTVSYPQIGRWVFPENTTADPKELGRGAKSILDTALGQLDTLIYVAANREGGAE
jgi:hypothetical protein